MKLLMKKLWNDEGGFILSTEAMILWTITVLGLIVGLVAIRDATVTELTEVANAIVSFDQSFTYGALQLNGQLNGGPVTIEIVKTNGSNAQDFPGIASTSDPVKGGVYYGVSSLSVDIAANNTINPIHVPAP
jgi:hypothetical protein